MIIECPGCQSRYDVTGRPPGTRARCRCGMLFELPETEHHARVLDCPRCGGHVAATSHRCEFCHVELRVKACPRCFARMFQGAKHCTQCGASVVEPAAARPDGEADTRHCPRCVTTILVARLIGDAMLDECPTCQGTFVDVTALERILKERRPNELQSMMNELVPPGHSGVFEVPTLTDPGGPMYVKCPDCHKHMNRRNFAAGSGIVIDVCRNHGTWFDKDELSAAIDFALSGGLDRARQKEMARREDEQRRKRASQRMAAMITTEQTMMRQSPRNNLMGVFLKKLGGLLKP